MKPLRVMIISDMAYLIHVRGLAELAFSGLQFPRQLHLLDTETDPPRVSLFSCQYQVVLPVPTALSSAYLNDECLRLDQ